MEEACVLIESTPRSDAKFLSLLREQFGEDNCRYAGGVGSSGVRLIIIGDTSDPDIVKTITNLLGRRKNFISCWTME